MNQQNSITLQISKLKNLPPLPEISVRIMNAVNDPEVSVDQLVEVISLSPTLTARLLGLANSAYFGRSGQIDDLRIAIIQVLGLNLVKSLALSIVLNVEMDTSKCRLFNGEYFWAHSFITAIVAQKLAVHINDELLTANTVYTSGLLLNIGLVAAVYILPEEMNDIFSQADRADGSISSEMSLNLGVTQYKIGEILLKRWKLPKVYQIVLSEFRKSAFNGKEKSLIKLLELSHFIGMNIVTDNFNKIPPELDLATELSLSEQTVASVINEIVASKDNIKDLAVMIAG